MESAETTAPPAQPAPQQKSAMPTAGGALLVIAGILGIIMWAQMAVAGGEVTQLPGVPADMADMMAGAIIACGVIGIILSIIALLGGVMALQRKKWGIALAGSILGLFTLGYLIGSILSLIALILIAISRKEFQ